MTPEAMRTVRWRVTCAALIILLFVIGLVASWGARAQTPMAFAAGANAIAYTGVAGDSIGAKFGATPQAAAKGNPNLAWLTLPQYGGVVLSVQVHGAVAAGSSTLGFVENWTGGIGNMTEQVAEWQDPTNEGMFFTTGYQISGCGIPGTTTTIAAIGNKPGQAGYGQITLSQKTTAATADGCWVTIQPTTAQFEAFSNDYIWMESYLYQAAISTGSGHNDFRAVYLPDDKVLFPQHPVCWYSWNSGAGNHLSIRGTKGSIIAGWTDYGPGKAVLAPCSMNQGQTGTQVSDLTILNTNPAVPVGQVPTQTNGLGLSAGDQADNVRVYGWRAGFWLVDDHGQVRNSLAQNNEYGAELAALAQTMGNQDFDNDSFTGNTVAGIAVACSNQFDSGWITHSGTGWSPYGIVKEAKTAIEPSCGGFSFLTNMFQIDLTQEATGNGFIKDLSGQGDLDHDHFNSVMAANGDAQYTGDALPGKANATIEVRNFTFNEVEGPGALSDFGNTSTAVVIAHGSCKGNGFHGLDAFVLNGWAGHPALICGSDGGQNTFDGGQVQGRFRMTGAGIKKGMALSMNSSWQVLPYSGSGFDGTAAIDGSTAVGAMEPVITHGTDVSLLLGGTVTIGQGITPTKGGGWIANTGGLATELGVATGGGNSGALGSADLR